MPHEGSRLRVRAGLRAPGKRRPSARKKGKARRSGGSVRRAFPSCSPRPHTRAAVRIAQCCDRTGAPDSGQWAGRPIFTTDENHVFRAGNGFPPAATARMIGPPSMSTIEPHVRGLLGVVVAWNDLAAILGALLVGLLVGTAFRVRSLRRQRAEIAERERERASLRRVAAELARDARRRRRCESASRRARQPLRRRLRRALVHLRGRPRGVRVSRPLRRRGRRVVARRAHRSRARAVRHRERRARRAGICGRGRRRRAHQSSPRRGDEARRAPRTFR